MSKQVQGILFPIGEDTEPLPIAVGDHININALVGGHFDAVRREFTPEELAGEDAPDGAQPFVAVGYVHDEGRIINLPLNKLATVVFGQELYGDVVLVSGTSPDGEYDGDNYDVPTWFADAVHNGSLAEASVLVERMSEVASCLALAVREGMATRNQVLLLIVGAGSGNEDAQESLSLLTAYGRLRLAGEIEPYVSTDTNSSEFPADWELSDEDIENFFNSLGGE